MTVASHHFDYQTQSAGTAIVELIPPLARYRSRLDTLVYTPAATAHDLILMKAINEVITTAAAAASDTSLVLSSASFGADTIASGDYLVVEHADGTYGVYLASGLSTLTVTINALAKAVNAGAKVWIMGAPGDSTYHLTIKTVASTKEVHESISGLIESGYDIGTYSRDGIGDPLLVYSANGTNAGSIQRGSASYHR